MKKPLTLIALLAGALSFAAAGLAQSQTSSGAAAAASSKAQATPAGAQAPLKTGGCVSCAQNAGAAAGKLSEGVSWRPIPGTNESMLAGRIENLIPIGVVMALGCETCAEHVVVWALEQGSSPGEVERAIETVAAMQKLDCFKQQFGGDTASRLEKPLAAGRRALEQAVERGGK